MGVLGLAPFLQKICPEAIKTLPNRLKSLSGKTVVIDGTLITQRLHFAPMPHPYRHVLGWYRIMQELKECDVNAICVFDGMERSHAKGRELERRRDMRRQDAARSGLEAERLRRLTKLRRHVRAWRSLEGSELDRVATTVRKLVQEFNNMTSVPLSTFCDDIDDMGFDALFQELHVKPSIDEDATTKKKSRNTSLSPRSKVDRVIKTRAEVGKNILVLEGTFDEQLDTLLKATRVPSAPGETLAATAEEKAKARDLLTSIHALAADNDSEAHTDVPIPSNVLIPSDVPIPSDKPKIVTWLTSVLANLVDATGDEHDSVVDNKTSKKTSVIPEKLSTAEAKTFDSSSSVGFDGEQDLPFSQGARVGSEGTPEVPEVSSTIGKQAYGPSSSVPTMQTDEPYRHTDQVFRDTSPAPCDTAIELPPEDLLLAMASLYVQYRESISDLASLSELPSVTPSAAASTSISEEEAVEARTAYAMSKNQHQLTIEEGIFWDQLLDTTKLDEPGELKEVEATITALTEKSSSISESYERRTHPPTTQTYHESKSILRALGVPCIESDGPFEAEALASALVINGYADYVASEDTDVLIYEAPLIRNISSRTGPIVMISAAEVRSFLQLDRERFIDFALLLGTDFSQRIKNIGPHRALKFIREYGSIERVLEYEKRYPPRVSHDAYLAQVSLARLVFQTLPPIPDAKLLIPGKGDEEEVARILEECGLESIATQSWDYPDALVGNYFDDDPSPF